MKKIITSVLMVALISLGVSAVNMEAIRYIESRGNPQAVGESGEIGLYQIMPITLKSYNQRHEVNYTKSDLFTPEINEKIASWYLEQRIPEMLRYYGLKTSIKNILWAYNAGISRVREGVMPEVTKQYIEQYWEVE